MPSLPPQRSLNLFSWLPKRAAPKILYHQSLFSFSYQPLLITSYWALTITPGMSAFRTTGLIVKGFQPERCSSKYLSMEFGKQQHWALICSLLRNYLPANLTKGATKAFTVLNTHTHISLLSHQSWGLFMLEKLQKFKKCISIQASHTAAPHWETS